MSSIASTLYRRLSPVLAAIAPLAARSSAKWRRSCDGRRGLMKRILDSSERYVGGVWFHASSVGEYEQARPVITGLRDQGVGPIMVTHFSSSGVEFARLHPSGDLHDYLPLDTPAAMGTLVRAWRPRCLVFAKYDSWPNQVEAAAAAGVPIVMISGALPAGSGRLHRLARPLFQDMYNRFTCIGTGSEADRRRFVDHLGVTCPVRVTGDTRAEQVIRRFEQSREGDVASDLRRWGGRRLVLGSTWPEDERIWWNILPEILKTFPDLKVIIVPHEPTTERVSSLMGTIERLGLPCSILSAFESAVESTQCMIVDRVGVLAEIYGVADVAFVGGGFTTGVHSTLEPAVAGLPVMFGPRIDNAEEAMAMVRDGGGRIVRSGQDVLDILPAWLHDDDARRRAGAATRRQVDDRIGATERSVAMILEMMDQQR